MPLTRLLESTVNVGSCFLLRCLYMLTAIGTLVPAQRVEATELYNMEGLRASGDCAFWDAILVRSWKRIGAVEFMVWHSSLYYYFS